MDMNWLVKFFWMVFEAMLAMSLPRQAGDLPRGLGGKGEVDGGRVSLQVR
jgi:hypothetical protein